MLKCIVYSQQKGDDRSKRMEISFLKGQEKHSKTKREKEQYTQKIHLRKDFFMKTKKLLSVVLIALMLLSCIPIFASAAEPIQLTEANVTVWPTANGSIYYGQRISDGITLSGGEVQYDGNVVAGHFEFIDPEINQTSVISSIRFIPDDMQKYSGFEILECWDVILTINRTTPVFVDENDTLPVATEVEPGAKLSTSILSGALIMNPYYPEEPKALAAVWKWSKGSTIVNESGYYEARISAANYERISALVYVKVKGNVESTEIIETPTLKCLELGKQWKDVTFEGGKAVVKGETEEVAGTYSITKINSYVGGLNFDIGVGEYIIEVTFTPDDREKYLISTTTLTVTVNKAPVKFVDENGNEIIPEIELGYNNKQLQHNLDEIKNLLAPYANCDQFYANFYANSMDMPHAKDALEVGTTKEYEIHSHSYNDNYTSSILKFKLTVVPRECSMTLRYADNIIKVQTNKPTTDYIYGTFEYYANGELIGTSAITTATDSTALRWKPEKSGTYDITVKYVVAENDKYYFPETTIEDMEILCSWGVTVNGGSVKVSNSYKDYGTFTYGDSVSILGAGAMFSHWVITDKDGNEIDLDGVDKTVSGNTFIMPDFNVTFTAVELTQRKVNLENAIILNVVGTADAPVRYRGENVRIKLDTDALSEDLFNKWVITDADGKEFLPEGLTESDLTSTQISFIMPDHDITVRAATAADDCDHLCHSENPIYQFFWKILHFIFRLFNVQQYCDCGMKHYESPLFSF